MTDRGGAPEPTDLFHQWMAHREGRPFEPEEPQSEPAPEAPAEPETAWPADDEAETAVEPPTPRRPTHAGPPPSIVPELPNHNTAAASILAALQPQETAPEPVMTRPLPGTTVPGGGLTGEPAGPVGSVAAAHQEPAPSAKQEPAPAPVRSLPQTIFFKPRAGTQRFLGLLLLVFLVITAGAAWWAWQERSYLSYVVLGAAAVVTAITWATRTSAGPARLTLHGSDLEIVRSGSRALFDLAHTQVEMQGTPGSRKWRVLLLRRSMSPYVIDRSMVDPREFTEVLRFFHPDI